MCAVSIRQALPQDAPAILAFMKQIGGESENLSFGSEGLPFTIEQEQAFLQSVQDDSHSVFLCAWEGPALVGTASLTSLPRRMSHRVELSVSVKKDHWGHGIGSALMAHLIDYARRNGVEIISLEVRSDNAPAIRLYEKFDFQRIGIFPAFFKIGDRYADFVLMYLDLR